MDWTEGFRYRGFASAGGAGLSVLVPVGMVLALHLYAEKFIGLLSLACLILILFMSLFFIGRTGFVLLPVVFLSFVFFNLRFYFFRVLFFVLILLFAILFFGDQLRSYMVGEYGEGFYNYSFGFLLRGAEGIKNEGTVEVVFEFLKVLPTTFPEVLIGYGFYGGGEFSPWTDSGYARTFLSVGYFFGVLFYIFLFLSFKSALFCNKFLFLTIGVLLMVAEIKEPILFTGYAARVYIFLLAFFVLERNFTKRQRLSFQAAHPYPNFFAQVK